MATNPKHRPQSIRIKMALIEKGLVQREAAAKLGMVVSSFNMKLRGERPFTDEEKQELAKILEKPVGHLFPDEEKQDLNSCPDVEEGMNAPLPDFLTIKEQITQ